MTTPQTPLEVIAGQLDWAHSNILNNLDFLPEDKINWKPAPSAKSVLEIINHATGTVHMFTSAMTGGAKTELTPASDRQSAKSLLTQVIQAHQNAIRALEPSEMERIVSLPIGDLPVSAVAGLPVIELVNHHGQITYIQSLLGDEESHLIIK